MRGPRVPVSSFRFCFTSLEKDSHNFPYSSVLTISGLVETRIFSTENLQRVRVSYRSPTAGVCPNTHGVGEEGEERRGRRGGAGEEGEFMDNKSFIDLALRGSVKCCNIIKK